MPEKRVWKPLNVAVGYRLYRVRIHYCRQGGDVDREVVVAAGSPSEAARLMEPLYGDDTTIITGHALNVYQPADWWENGIPTGQQ
jgi:hypothetical protein